MNTMITSLGFMLFPGSRLFYYLSILLVVIILPSVIFIFLHFPDLFGYSLSEWIGKTRRKNDEDSARKLQIIQKMLGTLAHDVLKHRLLGLVSLVCSIEQRGQKQASLQPEEYDAFLEEIFRLCGTKATPHDRLWTRWTDTFREIKKVSDDAIQIPVFDPLLRDTHRVMMRLRVLFSDFVARDKANAISPESLKSLHVEKVARIHQDILKLSEGCRMVIVPETVIQDAIRALSLQMERKFSPEKITIRNHIQKEFLSPVPGTVLSTQIARLLDNALSQGKGISAIDVEYCEDEMDAYLNFHIFDTVESFPQPSEYGQGLRGLERALKDYECGFRYKRVNEEEFKKSALLVVPVSEVEELPNEKQSYNRFLLGGMIFILIFVILIASVHRIIGGQPIQFAGEGSHVIEFRINTGEQVRIPLCEGGSTPRVRVHLLGDECKSSQCTLNEALSRLVPCEQSLNAPECPSELVWTPTFEDGHRLGRSYELEVECFSPGPPESSDTQHIRLVVTRPNSAPELVFMQLVDNVTGETSDLHPRRLKSIPANANVSLKVVAMDKDTDLITYRLQPPVGQTLESYDGVFNLQLDWSQFGTWTAEVGISDGFSDESTYIIQLKAGTLRDIQLLSAGVWSQSYPAALPCLGSAETMLCNVTDDRINEFSMQVQYDPLMQNILGAISISVSEESPDYYIQSSQTDSRFGRKKFASASGDRWEIRSSHTHQQLALIELSNISKGREAGVVEYDFNVATTRFLPMDARQLVLNVEVSELSRRSKPLQSVFVFSRQSSIEKSFAVNSRHIFLTEYEKESSMTRGSETVHIYRMNPDLKEIRVSGVSCEQPSLEKSFETPVLERSGEDSWSLNIGLKPGCIMGLTDEEAVKNCTVTIADADGKEELPIWITVRNESCSPFFEKFELVSSESELKQNIARWNWSIVDPDGDLLGDSIGLSSMASALSLTVNTSPVEEHPGLIRYWGTVSGKLQCQSFARHQALVAKDADNHVIRKALVAPIACPPLVSTLDKQTHFSIDEGEELVVPLQFEDTTKVFVDEGVGFIEDSSYKWTGNCIYGKGPHQIVIRTESQTQYGNPLRLTVELARCDARFVIERDGVPLVPYNPVIIPAGGRSKLLFQLQKADQSAFEFNVELAEKNADMYVSVSDNTAEIVCNAGKAQNIVRIQAIPRKEYENEYLPSRVVLFEVRCE